ncbi:MAG: pyridoxal-phosphate dependent enzyme, partial [Ilumatobacteraceae bacterium]
SMASGELTHVPGPHRSIMVGMNCGLPSAVAWPRLASGVDWVTAVDDDAARQAMRDLAAAAVVAGETGAASLAGLRALLDDPTAAAALGDRRELTALIVVTEGATDAAAYKQIVGRSAESVTTTR